MAGPTAPQYLPPQLVTELGMEIQARIDNDIDTDDPDGRWRLERLMERAYATGYTDGHMRGYLAGRESVRRWAQIEAANTAKTNDAEVQV